MKKIIAILFLWAYFGFGQSAWSQQTFIGFDTTFVFLPPDSVRQNDTASFKIRIKNYGNFPTDSTLQIYSGVFNSGTLSAIAPEQTIPDLSNIVLGPNDTISTRVITNYTANRFALGIDVVVIWPKANNAITTDSLYYSVYVYPSNTAIADLLRSYGFTVFPNPFTDILHIKTQNNVERINVYDAQGRYVLSRSRSQTIDLSELKSASYFVELVYKSGSRKRIKVVKQNSGDGN
jgi:hypothetical protein